MEESLNKGPEFETVQKIGRTHVYRQLPLNEGTYRHMVNDYPELLEGLMVKREGAPLNHQVHRDDIATFVLRVKTLLEDRENGTDKPPGYYASLRA